MLVAIGRPQPERWRTAPPLLRADGDASHPSPGVGHFRRPRSPFRERFDHGISTSRGFRPQRSRRSVFGTGTFGGKGEFFAAWGNTDAAGARRLLDICLEPGVTMFDTADIYSAGESEEVLGAAIKGRRDKVLISTKATFRFGDEPNDVGSSRFI